MTDRASEAGSLGRYRLLHRLGHGGMGEVFLARAEGTAGWHKDVVVKRILPHLGDDPELRARFIDEGRIAARLSHANVVQVFDVGEEGGMLYLAMEAVDGWDLRTVLRVCRDGSPLPDRLALAVASAIAAALAHAHSRTDAAGRPLEIVHRDVSPANILLSREGEVKLTDFGIAAATSRVEKTLTGELKGKVAYMAPEQARGAPVDARADIYALGLVLFEMLTGQRALGHGPELEVLDRARAGRRPELASLRPDLPEPVVEVVERALAPEAPDRFADAEVLGKALVAAMPAVGGPASALDLRDWLSANMASITASTLSGGFAAPDGGATTGASRPPTETLVASDSASSEAASDRIAATQERGRVSDAMRGPSLGAGSRRRGAAPSDPRWPGPRTVVPWLVGSAVLAALLWTLLLARAEVEVLVRSTPSGATVQVDDRAVGEAPVGVRLRPGAYAVRLSMDGYLPHADVLRVRRGQPVDVEMALVAVPRSPSSEEGVRVVFQSLPAGAMVQVDDGPPFLAGNATSVPVGRPVRVRYTLEGHVPLEEELVLVPGDTIVTRALAPEPPSPGSAVLEDGNGLPGSSAARVGGVPSNGQVVSAAPERSASSRTASGRSRSAGEGPGGAAVGSAVAAGADAADSGSSPEAAPGVLAVRFARAPMLGEIHIEGAERRASRGLVEEFELPPGRYRVEVVNDAFGVRQQTTVQVVEGERRTWTVDWGGAR